jgi:hypothetical protein
LIWKTVVKEPLLHFLVLAGLFFVADAVYSSKQKVQIIVGQQTVDYLIKQRESMALRELSPEEKKQTIEAFIEDEILYLEAYKQGLDRRDTRMRRNMIRKMRGLLMGESKEPTDDDLRKYFEVNVDKYTYPKAISLQQVFFRHSSAIPEDLLDQLNKGLEWENLGDTTLSAARKMPAYSKNQLVQTLGPEMARNIIAINDQAWHGPLKSDQGVHFVRISERHPASLASFESIRDYLAADWIATQSQKLVKDKIKTFRRGYEIHIADKEQ